MAHPTERPSLADRRVLVTGADGFIGSHLAEELVRQGARVRAFVFYNSLNSWGWLDTASRDVRDSLDVFAGDIRDPHGVRLACSDCEIVFHLAALISIPFSYRSPDAYVETNVRGTLNLLQAARDLGIARFIHTSTSEVYGTARSVPITEDHPLGAQSPYAASKIGADQLALSFHLSFGTPVVVVRPFNTFGPRQSARAIIPTAIAQILAGQRRLRLGSLDPTRDFSYVSDTVSGFLSAARADSVVGEVLNLGTGYEQSIGEAVRRVARICGSPDIEIEADAARVRPASSEVRRLVADSSKARRLMDWAPRFAGPEGFERGLEATIEWFRVPENLARYRWDAYNV